MTVRLDWQSRMRMTMEAKWTELQEACAVGDSDLLEEMLKSGRHEFIDYKDPDWGERAPLHWCCIKGKSDMAMSLLEKGAHPGIRTSCGWTPAHYAAEGGKIHVLRMLHQYNSPMDRRDHFGDTPRRIAEIYDHKEAVDFLTIAEAEYRSWRRKAELTGEADPFDDEDLEWCRHNDFTPEKFVTEDELAEINSTVTSLSVTESISSMSKGRGKGHQSKKLKKDSSKRMSISSEKNAKKSVKRPSPNKEISSQKGKRKENKKNK